LFSGAKEKPTGRHPADNGKGRREPDRQTDTFAVMNTHHASLRAVFRAAHKRGLAASFRHPLALAFFAIALLPSLATAPANTITITGSVTGSVYGNSSNPDGSLSDLPATNNELNIEAGGSVGSSAGGIAVGASVYGAGAQTATGNTVNVRNGGTMHTIVIGADILSGRPSATRLLCLDFGIQGHAGKREGVTASFGVEYGF
jgi:hypothetical protein